MYFELENVMQFVHLNLTSRNMHGTMSVCISYVRNGLWKSTGYSMHDNAAVSLWISEKRAVTFLYNIKWLFHGSVYHISVNENTNLIQQS